MNLSTRIHDLTEQHGSLRAAARALRMTPAYMSRLASGEKANPSPAVLTKLGLVRVITYKQLKTGAGRA